MDTIMSPRTVFKNIRILLITMAIFFCDINGLKQDLAEANEKGV